MTEHWTEKLARNRRGLALMSFAESTVVPAPLEAIVAPLMLGHHRQALSIATVIWLGCMAGATLFYLVGLWLAEPVLMPLIARLGFEESFQSFAASLSAEHAFIAVFLVSFSPLPMQLATLGSGMLEVNFFLFLAAIALSRALRYYGLYVVTRLLGPKVASFNIPTGKMIMAMMLGLFVFWGGVKVVG